MHAGDLVDDVLVEVRRALMSVYRRGLCFTTQSVYRTPQLTR